MHEDSHKHTPYMLIRFEKIWYHGYDSSKYHILRKMLNLGMVSVIEDWASILQRDSQFHAAYSIPTKLLSEGIPYVQ